MRKFLPFIVAFLLLPVVGPSYAEDYRIGVILPLTGETASLGHFLKNGIELAYRSLPPEEQKSISLIF